MGGIRRVNLGNGEVEPTAAARGSTDPQVEVGRREADGQKTAREIRQAGDDAVDARATAHAGRFAVLRSGPGDDHFDLGRAGFGVEFSSEAGKAFGSRGVEAHPGGFGPGSQALGRRQDVQGVQQVGFALAVAADDQARARRQIERQATVVAEVGELELSDAHRVSLGIVTSELCSSVCEAGAENCRESRATGCSAPHSRSSSHATP